MDLKLDWEPGLFFYSETMGGWDLDFALDESVERFHFDMHQHCYGKKRLNNQTKHYVSDKAKHNLNQSSQGCFQTEQ